MGMHSQNCEGNAFDTWHYRVLYKFSVMPGGGSFMDSREVAPRKNGRPFKCSHVVKELELSCSILIIQLAL
jgi:hypothetical protein